MAACAASAQAAWRRTWTKSLHGYTITQLEQPRPYRQMLVLRDHRGRTAARIVNYHATVPFVRDLTGDGVPTAALRTDTGYGQGGTTYYLYRLGKRARCLLVYDKDETSDLDSESPDSKDLYWNNYALKPRDLDGDGRPELLSSFSGFAYRYGGHGGNAFLPVVLAYRHGRFVDVTQRHREIVRAWLAEYVANLRRTVANQRREPITADSSAFYAVARCYAIGLLSDAPQAARRRVLRLLRPQDRPEFLRQCPGIERIVRGRFRLYSYPPAYGPVPMHGRPVSDD
jgi:hypothetical protein